MKWKMLSDKAYLVTDERWIACVTSFAPHLHRVALLPLPVVIHPHRSTLSKLMYASPLQVLHFLEWRLDFSGSACEAYLFRRGSAPPSSLTAPIILMKLRPPPNDESPENET